MQPVDDEPEYDFSGLGFRTDQWAVVSGAASGIGRSVARILVRSGVSVAAWDVEHAGLENLAEESGSAPGGVRTRVVDTSVDDEIADAWHSLDDIAVQYLVNNAGPPSGSELSVGEGLRQAVGGYTAMTEHFLRDHAATAEAITFTASTAGNLMVSQTPDWYPTAKTAIVGYTRHLAVKLRGKPRCNAVAPGATTTPRTAAALGATSVRERLVRYPMGRAGQAWEVATVICFLLSPAASFVNGVLVPVEGASTWTQA